MKTITKFLLYLLFIFVFYSQAISSDKPGEKWSRFRGPNGSGVVTATGLPLEFGPDKNMIWKTELPKGHSSPILSEKYIFLTAFSGDTLFTYWLDRKDGKILWRKQSPRDRQEKIDARNNPASPSPVVDEENVYVFFADYGLISYDFTGNERWRYPLSPFNNIYGMGASPILADNKVILNCDQSTNSFLLALDKNSGKVIWNIKRPEAKSGHSTPILYYPKNGKAELIVPGSFFLTSYAIDSGSKNWWVSGLSFEMKSTPVMSDDIIFVNGYGSPMNQPDKIVTVPHYQEVWKEQDKDGNGLLSKEELPEGKIQAWFSFMDLNHDKNMSPDEWEYYKAALGSKNGMLGIRLGGHGDMTETNLLWQYHKSVPQLPSPLIYKNILYMVNDGGIVTSFNPSNGEVIKQVRLLGAVDAYYSSPVAADDKIFMIARSGKVSVLKPDGSLEIMAVNDLGDKCYATPAISNNRIYIRTVGALYCFGKL